MIWNAFATVDETRKVPKENYNFKNIITTKFKLNLGVEVKSLSVFLIFKNCFLRRTFFLTLAVRLV